MTPFANLFGSAVVGVLGGQGNTYGQENAPQDAMLQNSFPKLPDEMRRKLITEGGAVHSTLDKNGNVVFKHIPPEEVYAKAED